MKNEYITIPEYHLDCEFCIMIQGKFYCDAESFIRREIEDPKAEIDFLVCPIWGRIIEKRRVN